MNRENLQTLATYLAYAEKPPEVRFDMETFSDDEHRCSDSTVCGTVGCAAGFGPFAGIPKLPEELWTQYTERQFGVDAREFDWCFIASWKQVDNTPEGAAKRIQRMLNTGVPSSFDPNDMDDFLYDYLDEEDYEADEWEAHIENLKQRFLDMYKDVEVQR